MVPYYIESYPAYPTFFFDAVGFYRIEKYLLDPMGNFPQKVVLQGLGGVNCVEDLGDDPILLTTGKTTDTIDHYELSEVISMIDMGHGELEMLVEDLKGWGITTVRNSFSDSHETIDIDTFCQRAYDYCQTQEELDKWWNYSDEVLAPFFESEDSVKDSSTEENAPATQTSATGEFEKLGFPTEGFNDIPFDKQTELVKALYTQLSPYIDCNLEAFKYLLLPTYNKDFKCQPRILWHTGSQLFMSAVFSGLFPKDVIIDKKKSCCYAYVKEKGVSPKTIRLHNNLEKITDEDKTKVKGIISGCYKAIGLEHKTTRLDCE